MVGFNSTNQRNKLKPKKSAEIEIYSVESATIKHERAMYESLMRKEQIKYIDRTKGLHMTHKTSSTGSARDDFASPLIQSLQRAPHRIKIAVVGAVPLQSQIPK